jgi:hypothetical protein
MRRNIFLALLILIMGNCYAQESCFVLIQTDNNQPFYARLGDKTLSSTNRGHLIISQLTDGSHSLTIGFPKQSSPEQQYTFNINGRDLEFQLKEEEGKGWGLFDEQAREWLPVQKKDQTFSGRTEGIKKDDAFSRLMAGVVGDTAVMYNTYAMEAALEDSPVAKTGSKTDSSRTTLMETNNKPADSSLTGTPVKVDSPATIAAKPEKPATVAPDTKGSHDALVAAGGAGAVAAASSRSVAADSAGKAIVDTSLRVAKLDSSQKLSPDTAKTMVAARRTGVVVKLSERKTPKGLRLAFADKVKGKKTDTVIVIIPIDSGVVAAKSPGTSDSLKSLVPTPGNQPVAGAVTKELYRKPDSSQKKPDTKLVVVNSDCRNFATDYDVDRLRVKMLEISKDDDKIAAAKKIFKTKCFTTKQIRALSEVFTADASKYRFFETAYPFVSDDHFRELTNLLADPVYNSKFKAMTGQH